MRRLQVWVVRQQGSVGAGPVGRAGRPKEDRNVRTGTGLLATATTALLAAAAPAWAQAKLSLHVPFQYRCVQPGDQVIVELRLDAGSPGATAYQAFVEFDNKDLTFISGKYTQTPFGLPVAVPIRQDAQGIITLAAGIDVFKGQPPFTGSATVAFLEFATKSEDCAFNLDFCREGCQENKVVGPGAQQLQLELNKSQDIRVDGQAPRITDCCDPVTLSANAVCKAVLPNLTGCVTAKDNCDGPLFKQQFPPPNTLLQKQGTTVVTITVTDCAGNSDFCQVPVTVVDDTKPVIKTCPPNRTLKADNDCIVRVPDMRPQVVANDNCDNILTVTQNPAPNTAIYADTTVVMTVTDNKGNSASCNVFINHVDSSPPKIAVCPNDDLLKADDNCQAELPDYTGNIVAVDNCTLRPNLQITQNPPAGTIINGQQKAYPVTVTVTDEVGLSDTCTILVQVVDNAPPKIEVCAPAIKLPLGDNCHAILPNLTAEVVAVDNCGPVTITQSKPAGTKLLGNSKFWITITATDGKGNTDTCQVLVDTFDDTAPVIKQCSPQVKIPANANCQAKVPQMVGGVIANDNCDNSVTVTQSPAAGTLVGLGLHQIVLTATDDKGNSSTCTTTILVDDNTKPVIVCPSNITVECTSKDGAFVNFFGQIKVSDTCDPDPQLNCFELSESGQVIGIIPEAGMQYPNKSRTFVLCRATDAAGNHSECLFTVTVQDTTAPVITQCASNQTLSLGSNCKATVPDLRSQIVAQDTCSNNLVINQTPPAGSQLNGQGSYLVTFYVSDNSGNTATCKATLTAIDQLQPVFVKVGNDLKINANDRCQAQVPDLRPGFVAADNCTPAELITIVQSPAPKSLVGLGAWQVCVTATDLKGNARTHCVTLYVNDGTPPKVYECPDDVTLKADEKCQAYLPAFEIGKFDDNCDESLDVSQNPPAGTKVGLGVYHVIVSACDDAGNCDTCKVKVTVVDNTPPAITCPPDQKLKAQLDICAAFTDPGYATATDNCDEPKVTARRSDGLALSAAYPLGKTVITWTAKDESGNESTCEQSIVVNDNLPPLLTCPPNVSTNADPGLCTAQVDPGYATARDNCDNNVNVSWSRSDGLDLEDPYPAGVTTIKWTAVDDSGNSSSCTQVILVSDANTLSVDIDLAKSVASPLVRCITFTLVNCNTGDETEVEHNVTFINGIARNVKVKVPCGVYHCATARDRLHSLQRADNVLEVIKEKEYRAEFTGADALPLGNLDDNGIIDIIDWAIFASQFLMVLNKNTPCDGPYDPALNPHADISGNGIVFIEDHTYISANFRKVWEENCCPKNFAGGAAEADQGIMRISVEELVAMGRARLVVADLNGDGFVDLEDVKALGEGIQPKSVREFAGRNGDSWFDTTGWDGGNLPGADTDVVIPVNVRIDQDGAFAKSVVVKANGGLSLSSGSLAAGSLVVESGAALRLEDASALLQINSLTLMPGATLQWRAGTLEVLGGTFTTEEALFVGVEGEALLAVLSGGLVSAPVVYVGSMGELYGDGVISADVINDGLVQPEVLTVEGSFVQNAGGRLAVEIGGALDALANDVLQVTGDAQMGGSLIVSLPDSALTAGDRFQVVHTTALTGGFDSVELPALTEGMNLRVTLTNEGVTLTVARDRGENGLLGNGR
jgi:hypothetical protein